MIAKQVNVNLSPAGLTTVVPAVPGKRIRVLSAFFRVNVTSITLTFYTGADIIETILIPTFRMQTNVTTNFWRMEKRVGFWCETKPGQSLRIDNSAIASNVTGSLVYTEV
jgi:hypothetical protein